jgi:uncharacterized membrane protein
MTALDVAAPPSGTGTESAPQNRRRQRFERADAWLLAAFFCALYAALSLRDQAHMITTGFDLGIFDQAVRSYAHGHLPTVPLKAPGFDLLGDHFSPIVALLAPLYRLWPSADSLLFGQAALLAVGVVPPARWAADALGRAAGLLAGLGYGLSWGLASAVRFDVHEVAFAVPLLAFSASALGRRRHRAAVLWALPLLLVKEDLGVTLAAVGVIVALRGDRRLGWAVALLGVAGSLIEVEVVIPAINHVGYTYAGSVTGGSGISGGGLLHALRGAAHVLRPRVKLITLLLVFAPTVFLALRSPLAWLLLPTLAWRFLSDNRLYWGTGFQYSAVLMPIVSAAYVDALIKLRKGDQIVLYSRRFEARARIRAVMLAGLVVTMGLAAHFPLNSLASPGAWAADPRLAAARSVLSRIPDGASVSASSELIPQLADRDTVYLFDPRRLPDADWIVLDTVLHDPFPLTNGEFDQLIATAEHQGFRVVENVDGYLLLHRAE